MGEQLKEYIELKNKQIERLYNKSKRATNTFLHERILKEDIEAKVEEAKAKALQQKEQGGTIE